jgi:TldD protein
MKSFLKDAIDGLAVDYADIRAEEVERTGILYRGRDLDEMDRSFERGGCLRVFHKGNWVVSTFNVLDDSLVELAAEMATRVEKLAAGPGMIASLGPHDETVPLALTPESDAETIDPRKVPLAEKHALIRHYNDILLATDGISTTISRYQDAHREVAFLSSDDRYINQQFVDTGFSCTAVAKDGTDIQTYSDSFGKPLGFAALRNREPVVERIARVALDLLKAEPVEAGTWPVIIDPLLAGVFAHEAFGHLSEADQVAENEQLRQLMKLGSRFGVDELTIVDDATMVGERGSYRYDDEGASAERTELIRHGVLVERLHNRQTAQQLNEPPTGNARALSYRFPPIVRMSNTYIEPRSALLDDMLESMERGLYVVGSRGGMTELESFTFSAQYARLVEHGRLTRMVRNVTLSGNVFETMKNIDMIGDDLTMFGGVGGCGKGGQSPLPVGLGAPHVRIKGVVIGGR